MQASIAAGRSDENSRPKTPSLGVFVGMSRKVRSRFFFDFAKVSNSFHPAAPHRTPSNPITSTVSNGYAQRPATRGSRRPEKCWRIPRTPFGSSELCMPRTYRDDLKNQAILATSSCGRGLARIADTAAVVPGQRSLTAPLPYSELQVRTVVLDRASRSRS